MIKWYKEVVMKTVNNMQNVKRDDYITWDEYFIGIAKLSSMRSKETYGKK